jgi:ribose 5-phosphate isomerase A
LPVEVVRFGWRDTRRRLGELLPDAEQRLRENPQGGSRPQGGSPGEAYVTDEGHLILDCALPGEGDLEELGRAVKLVPGVVEHGLFIGMAERALLGHADGSVEVLERG